MKVNKVSQTLLVSAARTATTTKVLNKVNINNLAVIIDVTAIAATPSVVPTIEGQDPTSGEFYVMLTGAAITAVGTTVLRVGPDMPVTANLSAQDMVPENFRVVLTHADGDSITYSVGLNYEQNRPI